MTVTPTDQEKEIALAISEFTRDRDIWAQLRLDRLMYREQQLDKLTDRQREHILQFSGLALAAASIVGPFVLTNDLPSYPIALFAILLLFASALLGTGLTIWLLSRDRREVRSVLKAEQELLKSPVAKVVAILSKLHDGELPQAEVAEYLTVKQEAEEKFSKAPKQPTMIINGLYYLFLVTFFIGIVALLLSVLLGSDLFTL